MVYNFTISTAIYFKTTYYYWTIKIIVCAYFLLPMIIKSHLREYKLEFYSLILNGLHNFYLLRMVIII